MAIETRTIMALLYKKPNRRVYQSRSYRQKVGELPVFGGEGVKDGLTI
jgi:hypothetical protein